MTCGVCNPEAFRPEPGKRVFGYMTARNMTLAANGSRPLYFMGCEHVLCDEPVGHIRLRPAFKWLLLITRPGDRIIVTDMNVLGSTPASQNARIAEIEAKGGSVFALTEDAASFAPIPAAA